MEEHGGCANNGFGQKWSAMADVTPINGGNALLTPGHPADCLPSRPVFTTADAEWRGVTLQRCWHPPGTIEVPGLRETQLVDHLVGQVLVGEDRGAGRRERRSTSPSGAGKSGWPVVNRFVATS